MPSSKRPKTSKIYLIEKFDEEGHFDFLWSGPIPYASFQFRDGDEEELEEILHIQNNKDARRTYNEELRQRLNRIKETIVSVIKTNKTLKTLKTCKALDNWTCDQISFHVYCYQKTNEYNDYRSSPCSDYDEPDKDAIKDLRKQRRYFLQDKKFLENKKKRKTFQLYFEKIQAAELLPITWDVLSYHIDNAIKNNDVWYELSDPKNPKKKYFAILFTGTKYSPFKIRYPFKDLALDWIIYMIFVLIAKANKPNIDIAHDIAQILNATNIKGKADTWDMRSIYQRLDETINNHSDLTKEWQQIYKHVLAVK